jgi:hypothetical protein
VRIPQAIFTSLRGEQFAGYQLAAKSPEIGEDLARELTIWGPAHDSLLDEMAGEPSINFHPLGPEHFCLSVTSSSGPEYSGRAGARIYTQMFVLPHDALARFDNNPLLILRTLEAAGRTEVHDELPQMLRSVPLVGRAGEADLGCMERVLDQIPPEALTNLVTTLLESPTVGLATSLAPRCLFSALFQLLPPEERPRISFTTGLRHSPRRPFRLFLLPSDPAARRQFQRQPDMTVVELQAKKNQSSRAGSRAIT